MAAEAVRPGVVDWLRPGGPPVAVASRPPPGGGGPPLIPPTPPPLPPGGGGWRGGPPPPPPAPDVPAGRGGGPGGRAFPAEASGPGPRRPQGGGRGGGGGRFPPPPPRPPGFRAAGVGPGLVAGGVTSRCHSLSWRARAKTASNMGSVSLPVKVFCWLGWYEQMIVGPSGLRPRRRGRSAGGAAPRAGGPPRRRRTGPARRPLARRPARPARGAGRAGTVSRSSASACWPAARSARPRPRRRGERQPVVAGHAGRLVGVAGAVQGAEQPVARAVAR